MVVPKEVLDRLPPETRKVLGEALALVPRDVVPAPDKLDALLARAAETVEAPGPLSIARLTIAAVAFLVEALGEQRDEEAARLGVAAGVSAYTESKVAGQRAKCPACGMVWNPKTHRHEVDVDHVHMVIPL